MGENEINETDGLEVLDFEPVMEVFPVADTTVLSGSNGSSSGDGGIDKDPDEF